MAKRMTRAADRFTDEIQVAWDSATPFLATAEEGLSGHDEEVLGAYCAEYGEEYAEAEAEVMRYVREVASRVRTKLGGRE